jgi:hypothetical protein
MSTRDLEAGSTGGDAATFTDANVAHSERAHPRLMTGGLLART